MAGETLLGGGTFVGQQQPQQSAQQQQAPQSAQAQAPTLKTTNDEHIVETANFEPFQDHTEGLYGESAGMGAPLDNYASVLDAPFETLAFKARFDGDHDRAAEITKTGHDLNTLFVENRVPSGMAKEFASTFVEFMNAPLTAAEAEGLGQRTMADLSKVYRKDLDKNLAGARRVIDEFDRRIPGLKKTLSETGMGSHKAIVTQAIHIARRKGYVK